VKGVWAALLVAGGEHLAPMHQRLPQRSGEESRNTPKLAASGFGKKGASSSDSVGSIAKVSG
jgi:hypothetical protein